MQIFCTKNVPSVNVLQAWNFYFSLVNVTGLSFVLLSVVGVSRARTPRIVREVRHCGPLRSPRVHEPTLMSLASVGVPSRRKKDGMCGVSADSLVLSKGSILAEVSAVVELTHTLLRTSFFNCPVVIGVPVRLTADGPSPLPLTSYPTAFNIRIKRIAVSRCPSPATRSAGDPTRPLSTRRCPLGSLLSSPSARSCSRTTRRRTGCRRSSTRSDSRTGENATCPARSKERLCCWSWTRRRTGLSVSERAFLSVAACRPKLTCLPEIV